MQLSVSSGVRSCFHFMACPFAINHFFAFSEHYFMVYLAPPCTDEIVNYSGIKVRYYGSLRIELYPFSSVTNVLDASSKS